MDVHRMRALFLVNGLGLGNATRCHAVIQRLRASAVTIEVVTSGNGAWYFASSPDIARLHSCQALHYGTREGRLSLWQTLRGTGALVAALRDNRRQLHRILDAFNPSVVVTDSFYTFGPIRRRGIPLVSLNNAEVVCQAYRRFRDHPPSIRAQFYGVERMDCLYHRWIPDRVISPTLDPTLPESGGPFRRVAPIVREAFRGSTAPIRRQGRVVILLSGSVFATQIRLDQASHPFQIDVVGRSAPPGESFGDHVTFHGRVRNAHPRLQSADLVVVNGGFSAISEVFCLQKPMVVVPVPNHAEQWVNARTIAHLGVGVMATEETLEATMVQAWEQWETLAAAYQRLPPLRDGAAQAAAEILQAAR